MHEPSRALIDKVEMVRFPTLHDVCTCSMVILTSNSPVVPCAISYSSILHSSTIHRAPNAYPSICTTFHHVRSGVGVVPSILSMSTRTSMSWFHMHTWLLLFQGTFLCSVWFVHGILFVCILPSLHPAVFMRFVSRKDKWFVASWGAIRDYD